MTYKNFKLSMALFTLGEATLIVCTIGLIASCHANRTILIIYEVALILGFITHIIVIIILVDVIKNVLKSDVPLSIKENLDEIVKYQNYYIIPNVVALVVEFFFIVVIPFLIKRISKANQENRTVADSEINMGYIRV